MSKLTIILIFMLLPFIAFAGDIKGTVTDSNSGEALVGANVSVQGESMGAATDSDGYFVIKNVPAGEQTLVFNYVGYKELSKTVTVTDSDLLLEIDLESDFFKSATIIVEGSRAKERETPVAFTNIGADEISKQFTVQDIPHMFKNTPGIYVSSDGGSGMGDSKVSIRGFDEQRISVMINNIEVNDPESKKVYWSNWGSLPSGTQSIQVQRGAGSSLYGAGAFGGSINVQTADAPAVSSLNLTSTVGLYDTYKLGVDYNSGLIGENLSFVGRVNYMEGNGWRNNTFYRGLSYYFGLSYFAAKDHTLRVVLHGAPQYHAYSYYSNSVKSYVKYGKDYNSNPFVKDGDKGLTSREKDGTDLFDLLTLSFVDSDKGGEIIGNGLTSFDNNVFHKPQFELHHTWDMGKNTYLQTTAFGTIGRGYGENVKDAYKIGRDSKGLMTYNDISNSGLYQYRNHSIHEQVGLVSTFNTQWMGHELKFGAEGRYWQARHYGLVLNTFGNDNAKIKVGGINQYFKQGNIYYDYTGTKPNFSVFGHALWKFDDLSIMTDLQFSSRMYNIKEDFPSGNSQALPSGGFALGDTTYRLLDYDKTFDFLSPKFGVNYNISDQLNVFANYSRVFNEPRVKYFFNQGQPNDDLKIETSDDYELGFGYTNKGFNVKLNLYQINFDNKAFQVTDRNMANEPGYDYKGRRYVEIGEARYRGIEFSSNMRLTNALDLGIAVTKMENMWTGNLTDEAKSLGIEDGNTEPGTPQFIFASVLNYLNGPFYASASMRLHKDYYITEDNRYHTLEYNLEEGATDYGQVLPTWTVIDLIVGWSQPFMDYKINASLHINNLLDEEYFQIGNKYGMVYGAERNIMLNLGINL